MTTSPDNNNSLSSSHLPLVLEEQLAVRPGEVLKILLIDPDLSLAQLSRASLEFTKRISGQIAISGHEALVLLNDQSFDAVVSDYDMPDMNGIDLHHEIQDKGIKIPFIFFTVPDEVKKSHQSGNLTRDHKLSSTSPPDNVYLDLSQKIIQAVELYRTRNRLELYSKHLEELVEERTRQAQRFAVIGELSTMIGHDMRNPLQVITNMHYLLTRKVAKMDPNEIAILQKYGIQDLFSRIGIETQYLNKIVSDLQNYAREVNPKKTLVDPGTFLNELLGSIPLAADIRIQTDYLDNLEAFVDPILFRRVMENLIINAIQAMEQGGVLTLKTSRENDLISITVSDTGNGIPVEAQERIFEPLFTTKSKGTGFGLPVCKRLVEAHGGTISLKKTSPAGTSFEVLLPPPEKSEIL